MYNTLRGILEQFNVYVVLNFTYISSHPTPNNSPSGELFVKESIKNVIISELFVHYIKQHILHKKIIQEIIHLCRWFVDYHFIKW